LTLKKASALLIVAIAVVASMNPVFRQMFRGPLIREAHLAHPITVQAIVTILLLFFIVALGNFIAVCMRTGRKVVTASEDGWIFLRIKVGPRWFFIIVGCSFSALFLWFLFSTKIDIRIAWLFWIVLAMFGHATISAAALTVRYNDQEVRALNWYFRERSANWEQLTAVQPAFDLNGYLKLRFTGSKVIRIAPLMEGYDSLIEYAEGRISDA